ncbi:hypothetical protein [Aureivirga sp. CE67]|uniref:hypothetical protein n=1 Tax=Aureivirga sp. CE67 TaxID=1788983 RepID=UPI0018C90ED5|nr:hypothetical protein [Aureivirga sp. CE67]
MEKKEKEIIEAKSSFIALLFNGQPMAILRPWRIKVDTKRKLLTVKRRNWHLFSHDEETHAFRSIRNVKIDTHLFGADLSIRVYAGKSEVFYLRKKKAKMIKEILLENDWNLSDADIFVDMN